MHRKAEWSRWILTVVVLFLFVATAGCSRCSDGGGGEEEVRENAPKPAVQPHYPQGDAEERVKPPPTPQSPDMEDLKKLIEDMKNTEPAEAVDYNKMLGFLPTSVQGWESRTEAEGESSTLGRFKFTHVRRNFAEAGGDGEVLIDISDTAPVPFLSMSWKMRDKIEHESSGGYTKVLDWQGVPTIEKYQNKTRRGELSLLIGERFMVRIEGRKIEDTAALFAVAETIDIDGLDRLATQLAKEGESAEAVDKAVEAQKQE